MRKVARIQNLPSKLTLERRQKGPGVAKREGREKKVRNSPFSSLDLGEENN